MKISIAFFLSLLTFALLTNTAQSQTMTSSTEYNRWSASLYTGYIFEDNNRGLQLFASNFNATLEPSWAYGGDIRYALTPFWSIESGYRFSNLEGGYELSAFDGAGFETTIHSVSIKNTFNLNRLYRRNRISEFLNPYLILGIEQDFFNASNPDTEITRNETSFIGGLGVGVRLSSRFEMFAQQEIKVSSNQLDLIDSGIPYDQIGMASAGIRIYFGSSNKKTLNLKPATRQLTDTEFNDVITRIRKVDELDTKFDDQENRIVESNRAYNIKIEELNSRIAALEARVDSLEKGTKYQQGKAENESEIRTTVEAGHYVQVFAARGLNNATTVKKYFQEELRNEFDNPNTDVFIIQRRDFYEVLIGTFEEFASAQQILSITTESMEDSFIITFPRPLHLLELYEGTGIIHN